MRTLPIPAQRYLFAMYLAALLSAGWAALTPLPPLSAHVWEVGLFLGLAVVAYGKKIVLMRHTGDKDAGAMSLGFAITFAALLRFGPQGALVIGTLGCLSSCLYPKRNPGFQLAFNVSLAALSSWLAGLVFLGLNGGTLALHPVRTPPAVLGASLTYFLLNTGGVAVVLAFCTGGRAYAVWKEAFVWTAPSYFAGACLGTLAAFLCGSQSWLLLLFLAPMTWLTYQAYAVYANRAEERQRYIERLADLYLGTIKSLALAIDAKDQHSHQHILRVQRYAVALARKIGLGADDLEAVNTGALLHDIGKLGVPDYVLLKPGRLTEEEFAKIKKHPEIGAAILESVEFPWPVLPVVRSHHEKWDGTGYPDGLAGEAIPLTARILAVADVYDALTSSRSYRNAWTPEAALDELRRAAGTQFDPAVVEAFALVLPTLAPERVGRDAVEEESPAPDAAIVRADDAARHIQRASSELWALYEVAQTLSSSLGLQETLEILARKLGALLPGTACLFLLRDGAEDALVSRVAVGLNQEFFAGARAGGLTSRSLRVATGQKTYRGGFEADDLLLLSSESTPWTRLEAALIVPIVHQGEVLGTINLYHPEADAFGAHDQQLLETIAERAAMALYNGLLFDRTRSHAVTDPLTGLYNVRYLTEKVDALCARLDPAQDRMALLCLDLDSFKPINDNFGHQKGDQTLRDLAQIFTRAVRPSDIVARYGGDEFLVVLHDAGPDEAAAMTRRLHAAVTAYDPGLEHPALGALRLGVSIGWGCFPGDGQDCAALVSAADAHMYRQKTKRKLGRLAEPRPDIDDLSQPEAPDPPALEMRRVA